MIAEMTQLSSRQVERILAKLKQDGVLIRRGSRTNGWWEISE
jgi:predicted HTH transcriptional regulator